MKKKLEEQIINLYLNNSINNNFKEKLLAILSNSFDEQLSRFQSILNNSMYLKNAANFNKRQCALEEHKLDILERIFGDETHAKSVFDSVVKKNFINGNDQKGYSVYNHYMELNPDVLTDEEFIIFDNFFEMQYGKILKIMEGERK